MLIYRQTSGSYTIRTETYNDRAHIVVPVIMMKEGVHNGSGGPLFHSIGELGKFPETWNGIPITLQHPQEAGNYVSANSPNQLGAVKIGRVFNTHVVNNELRAEAWLDRVKANELAPVMVQQILDGTALDVSVGVFSDNLATPGAWNGESYAEIATNHRPDHLALLPGGTGACSWDDGCGIRANQKNKKTMTDKEKFMQALEAGQILQTNEVGYHTIGRNIQNQLDAMDTERSTYYIVELYAADFIYKVNSRNGVVYYRQAYKVDENNVVTMEGQPTEVRQDINYNSNLNIEEMERTNKACCPEKVTELISNAANTYAEADREWLQGLTADQLAKMQLIEVHVELTDTVVKEKLAGYTQEELLSLLPEAIGAMIQANITANAEAKKEVVDFIIANTEKVWTEESLNALSSEMLDNISKTIPVELKKKVVDYSARNPQVNHKKETNQEGNYPPGVE